MNRLTWKRCLDGYEDVGLQHGATVDDAVCRLADYEGTGLEPKEIMALIHPPNAPLTLEELREMSGEPVWCTFTEESDCPGNCYMIIQWHSSEFFKSYECGFLLIEEYGKSWLAYRRKPEEGTAQ